MCQATAPHLSTFTLGPFTFDCEHAVMTLWLLLLLLLRALTDSDVQRGANIVALSTNALMGQITKFDVLKYI